MSVSLRWVGKNVKAMAEKILGIKRQMSLLKAFKEDASLARRILGEESWEKMEPWNLKRKPANPRCARPLSSTKKPHWMSLFLKHSFRRSLQVAQRRKRNAAKRRTQCNSIQAPRRTCFIITKSFANKDTVTYWFACCVACQHGDIFWQRAS